LSEPGTHPPNLTARVENVAGTPVVYLAGELDLASVGLVTATLEKAVLGASKIVVNVQDVSFIDSSGLRELLVWRRRCADEGIGFTLSPGTPRVRRVFEVTGLLDRLPLVRRGRGEH